ncbi:hypothetical protein [Streptomyces sp. NPDC052042]|uniref:hypothetical protein n=1 Tax=Streptomyces sp. NPDC052042 TaxID=3365683 RepID=UPI0037D781AE
MTTGSRPRFSVRVGLAAAPDHDGPFEDVPEHLLVPLQKWVNDALHWNYRQPKEEEARAICLRLRIPSVVDPAIFRRVDFVQPLAQATGAQLLDVVDEVLQSWTAGEHGAKVLTDILDDAGSAYRVNEAMDGLEERVTPAVRDAVRQTIADAAVGPATGSAADHLAAAWQAAYGRGPDPVRAYSEAIKAVEAAAHATIQANNKKATLGTMLGEINNARHKFDTAIPTPAGKDAIAPAEAMMRALWEGQTSRHGDKHPQCPKPWRPPAPASTWLLPWFSGSSPVPWYARPESRQAADPAAHDVLSDVMRVTWIKFRRETFNPPDRQGCSGRLLLVSTPPAHRLVRRPSRAAGGVHERLGPGARRPPATPISRRSTGAVGPRAPGCRPLQSAAT